MRCVFMWPSSGVALVACWCLCVVSSLFTYSIRKQQAYRTHRPDLTIVVSLAQGVAALPSVTGLAVDRESRRHGHDAQLFP